MSLLSKYIHISLKFCHSNTNQSNTNSANGVPCVKATNYVIQYKIQNLQNLQKRIELYSLKYHSFKHARLVYILYIINFVLIPLNKFI